MVKNIYKKAALDCNYTKRDSEPLEKFYRLVADRKKKVHPICPPAVQRAQSIAQEMHSGANYTNCGGDEDDRSSKQRT